MKLTSYFDAFLRDTVNLNQTRLDQLSTRVAAIVGTLEADAVLGPKIEEHLPQGSWAHRTIIKPLPNKEFDADILLHLTEDSVWSADPQEYIKQLRAAFARSSTYSSMLGEGKTRCVRIVYANDCHVDVVPYLMLADGREVIINSRDSEFEETNPQGFTDWMKERDDLSQGNLRKVIRLMKYLRDYKGTFAVPSVILTTFLGERVQDWDVENRYSDIPTTLLNVAGDLDSWLAWQFAMPTITDPSCPGTDFNHRWSQPQFDTFKKKISEYHGWIKEAYDETDKAKSVTAWQRVFGEDFKQPASTTATESALTKSAEPSAFSRLPRAPREEYIQERGYSFGGQHMAEITATVTPGSGARRTLRSIGVVDKNRQLAFHVTTDTPKPFDIYWKVRNTGAEAQRANDLRGEIVTGNSATLSHEERTKYSGPHFIECYIVKNRQVVAIGRHNVFIR
jgi:hypothetical protein